MKIAKENNLQTSNHRKLSRLKSALLVPACGLFLNFAASSQAAVIDLWANLANSDGALQLQNYQYDTATGNFELSQIVNASATYNIHGSVELSAVHLSGDGKYLTMMSASRKGMVAYDLATGTFSKTVNVTTGTNGRNVWSPDGQSFYIVGTSAVGSPGYVESGGTTATPLSSTTYSMLDIGYYNNALFFSRGAAIYKYPIDGLPTTTATGSIGTTRQLTGTGWGSGVTYNGFSFLGEQILFVLNTTNSQIEAYFNDSLTLPNDNWDLFDTVSTRFTDLNLGAEPIQISLYDNGDGSAQLFFTSGDALGTVAWLFNEETGTWGFSDISLISEAPSGMNFHGIVAVPEPSTWILCALGVAVFVVRFFRRRTQSS